MRERTQLVFGSLMKWIMQAGQTQCVHVIDARDYDAFYPTRDKSDGGRLQAVDQLSTRPTR